MEEMSKVDVKIENELLISAAYNHVKSVPPDDAQSIMWHGWALRDAFIAGANYQSCRNNRK